MKRNLALLFGIILVNYLFVNLQTVVSALMWDKFAMSESRYWIQSLVLLMPLVPLLALKFRYGRQVLGGVLALSIVTAVVYTVKAQIPGTRRNHQVAACQWAIDYIRRDYRGPKRDAVSTFCIYEYSRPERPIVDAFSARVGLMLGGRNGVPMCGPKDLPDYLVDEQHRLNWDWFVAGAYEPVAEKQFGKRLIKILKLKQRLAK